MEDNVVKIEKFFQYNLAVKKLLVECQPPYEAAPQSNSKYAVDYVVEKYADKLFYSLRDIKIYIIRMMEMFNNFLFEKNNVLKMFEAYEQEIIKCEYDFEKLKKVYQVIFCDMREELVKEVSENCIGYSWFRGVSLTKAQSINELLHIIHSTTVNDENLYGVMPKRGEKINDEGYSINLYGADYDLAKEIFLRYPLEMSSGQADILGLENSNKVLMMIRDRGHALSIELQEDKDRIFVNYFIPKICNMDMVNALKGVKKVKVGDRYTVGMFEVSKKEAALEVIDLISKVPMDDDMVFDDDYFVGRGK